jgi:hypothetical protein
MNNQRMHLSQIKEVLNKLEQFHTKLRPNRICTPATPTYMHTTHHFMMSVPVKEHSICNQVSHNSQDVEARRCLPEEHTALG